MTLQRVYNGNGAPEPVTGTEGSSYKAESVGYSPSTSSESGTDAVTRYLREIQKWEILSAEQQISLAWRVQAGDEQARERLITSNLRLVVKIAHEYTGMGLPLLDLISEGNMGLMKAVERFDPTLGTAFLPYANLWIRQAIRRALDNYSRTVRLPVSTLLQLSKVTRAREEWRQQHGRLPTDEESARVSGVTAERIREMREAAQGTVSLDAPVKDGENMTFADAIVDEHAVLPDVQTEQAGWNEMMESLIHDLTEREAMVLIRRFGLDGEAPESLASIGERLGVVREAVRQTQERALAKMRQQLALTEQVPVSSVKPWRPRTAPSRSDSQSKSIKTFAV